MEIIQICGCSICDKLKNAGIKYSTVPIGYRYYTLVSIKDEEKVIEICKEHFKDEYSNYIEKYEGFDYHKTPRRTLNRIKEILTRNEMDYDLKLKYVIIEYIDGILKDRDKYSKFYFKINSWALYLSIIVSIIMVMIPVFAIPYPMEGSLFRIDNFLLNLLVNGLFVGYLVLLFFLIWKKQIIGGLLYFLFLKKAKFYRSQNNKYIEIFIGNILYADFHRDI